MFKSTSRNDRLFWCEKEFEVFVKLWTRTGYNFKTFHFESVETDVNLFSLLLAFYYTTSRHQLALIWVKVCSLDHDMSKERARNFPLASTDVPGGGRLHDEPKECQR